MAGAGQRSGQRVPQGLGAQRSGTGADAFGYPGLRRPGPVSVARAPFESAPLGAVHASWIRSARLWLNRDGTPTLLTEKLHPKLLGDRNTTDNRFALQAYMLGGETEFWRAYRHYAGVLHFVYLTSSDPKAFISDHFLNVKTLELEPHFVEATKQAFNPLGVYLNFWQPQLAASGTRDYTVAMVNDEDTPREGKLRLVFRGPDGREVSSPEVQFSLPALGAESYTITLKTPDTPGRYSLEAIAASATGTEDATVSRRDVTLLPQAQ